ncbi:hypothetical protein AGMMS50276_30110 [Synergistales bacterium]|nr:hypothetical protein AGMMS50276_30110 [Synergistales bacterium]
MPQLKFNRFAVLLVLIASILFSSFFSSLAYAFDISDFNGPKMTDLYYVVMRDADAQTMAITSGKLDVLGDIFRAVDVERLEKSGLVDLSMAANFHGFFLTFNTRKFPFDQKVLRQAASQVMDRTNWTRDLFSGYAEAAYGFIPEISPYYDADSKALPYDVEAARKLLSDAGWTWSAAGRLTAPDGKETPHVKILCPPSSVAATSTEIALLAADGLSKLGMSAEAQPMDFQTMLARVDERDFDACTNAWTMSRDPDLLYAFYHSSWRDIKGAYNLSGIADEELDKALLSLRNAPSEAEAREAALLSQRLLSDLVPVVPIYSRYSVAAIRKDWDGVYANDRVTSDNLYTLLSMTPKGAAAGETRPIYWNLPEEVRTLNPLVSGTAYDWTVLGSIYDSLISVNPETFEDMPWLAESWSIETGVNGSILTFTLRAQLKWQDGFPLTVDDVKYSLEFLKDNQVPRYFDSVSDMERVETDARGRTVKVYMSNTSYWHLHNIGGMIILPKHILEKVPDWRSWQPTNAPHKAADGSDMTELIGTGPFIFKESRVGEYVRMTRNPFYMLFSSGE